MRRGLWYTGAALGVALLVGLAGGMLAGWGSAAVWLGAGLGLLVQVVAFWLLAVLLLPHNLLLAHGLGVLVRFGAAGAAAFLIAPRVGSGPAPFLFSLVAVLALTTLAEPLVLQFAPSPRR